MLRDTNRSQEMDHLDVTQRAIASCVSFPFINRMALYNLVLRNFDSMCNMRRQTLLPVGLEPTTYGS